MRPIRLTLQAFGPFAAREVIDFRQAIASGLFGIYGQTGAGKSTVFCAMTFALFGEAAKVEQEAASLRSDHADPALPTEVEFIFEIGNKRYVIRRRPEQVRPKLRGSGETKDAHEAWLFDATGLPVDQITEDHWGKIIAEKKTGAVRDAIVDLLGYGPEQFRQIVLLPQGRFETFLAAKTDARLGILRELFDVSIYRRLAAKMKEDAAEAERQVRQEREVCTARLKVDGFESPDALVEGIATMQLTHTGDMQRETDASKQLGDERTKLDASRQLDALFQAAEKADVELAGLLQREQAMAALSQRIEYARRAQLVTDVENHFCEAETELADAVKKRDAASGKSVDAAEIAQRAAVALENERSRSDETTALRQTGEALGRYRGMLTEATGLEIAARAASAALPKAKEAYNVAARRCIRLGETKSSESTKLTLARGKETERRRLLAEGAILDAAQKLAKDFEDAEKMQESARSATTRARTIHAECAQKASAARARFDQTEANLATAQALHLAAKLLPGDACPVCGSHEHPAPATGQIEHVGLDKEFRDAKLLWETAQKAEQESGRSLASAEATQKEREDRLSELKKPDRSLADLRADKTALTQKIEELGPEIDFPAAEARLTALDGDMAGAEQTREQLRLELEAADRTDAIAQSKLEQALVAIPEAYRQPTTLDCAIAENRRAQEARKSALEGAEKSANNTRDAALGAAKDAEAANATLTEATLRHDRARTAFERRLTETGLSQAVYLSYKPLIATIDSDARTFDDYSQRTILARGHQRTTKEAIADAIRPALQPLEEAVQQADTALRNATNARAQTEARLKQLRDLQQDITDTLSRLDQIEADTAALRQLAALFNAENTQRLDLETFAIGAMFDQVLKAANQRLGPMTGGRYSLEREIEASSGRSRRGLGIKVSDVYTGKARSPATLSGGETFIAALALALGLSDVVESVSGKIRLDTIFIDEGFGSLDTDDSGTLDQVLQVLTNLVSQQRSVGLISHVPFVQEVIPNGFYVRKDMQGSHVEARGTI
ncbi:AAA family ATPase [Rhodopseudomonas pseudopalustris]|uniref:Exonuclease SbcC n=1 Tax=Rhodopseudomonas pseudopalustris TaxID=1513892 RepID=A0A1H8XAS5_9BRAD|nr:SMC family ATPase [Rhodopseudomonas pseudopalustris]SEP36962.1 exonuclease SbcC [Rhodopseudomonas pseudopalustris]